MKRAVRFWLVLSAALPACGLNPGVDLPSASSEGRKARADGGAALGAGGHASVGSGGAPSGLGGTAGTLGSGGAPEVPLVGVDGGPFDAGVSGRDETDAAAPASRADGGRP